MFTVRAAPPAHYDWIAKRANLIIGSNFGAIEAIDDAGRILGMVGFDGWTPNAVSMHVALDSPIAARRLLKVAFWVAFVDSKKGVVLGLVLSTNKRALKLDRHLGFTEIARIKDGWAVGVDTVVFQMRREECRWIDQLTDETRAMESDDLLSVIRSRRAA